MDGGVGCGSFSACVLCRFFREVLLLDDNPYSVCFVGRTLMSQLRYV